MTTLHYGRQFGGQAQCAVFTSWTHGLLAPPTSGLTGGGKIKERDGETTLTTVYMYI